MSQTLNHIACIDDDQDILVIAKFALEYMGKFQVTTFQGAQAALECINLAKPDLVLLDVMMPELDGPNALRAFATFGVTTPVIFMTARVQPADVLHYMALGAIGVIGKPFDPMTVAQEVRDVWNRRRFN